MLVVLALHTVGGVTGGVSGAAAALLGAVDGQQPEVDLVQFPLAVVKRLSRILRLAQPVDMKRRATRRGALGLWVQGGRGRRQRALPPNTSSVASTILLPRRLLKRGTRRCPSSVVALTVRGVAAWQKAELVVMVVVVHGDKSKAAGGFPVHPRSFLVWLDPSGPGIHWGAWVSTAFSLRKKI